MGYEVKLFVVSEHTYKDGKPWAEVLAMFDVCKVGFSRNVFMEEAEGEMHGISGNDPIETDAYGEPLRVDLPKPVIEELRKIGEKYDYWRAKVAANLIEDIVQNCNTRGNIRIYAYGH